MYILYPGLHHVLSKLKSWIFFADLRRFIKLRENNKWKENIILCLILHRISLVPWILITAKTFKTSDPLKINPEKTPLRYFWGRYYEAAKPPITH